MGELGQGVGVLKRDGGLEPTYSLTNYGDYKTIQSKLSKYEQVESGGPNFGHFVIT